MQGQFGDSCQKCRCCKNIDICDKLAIVDKAGIVVLTGVCRAIGGQYVTNMSKLVL